MQGMHFSVACVAGHFFFLFAPCFLFVFGKVRGQTRKPLGREREKGYSLPFFPRPLPNGFHVWPVFSFRALCLFLYEPQTKNTPKTRLAPGLPFLVPLPSITRLTIPEWDYALNLPIPTSLMRKYSSPVYLTNKGIIDPRAHFLLGFNFVCTTSSYQVPSLTGIVSACALPQFFNLKIWNASKSQTQ